MSYVSCLTAAQQLLAAALAPTFRTVGLRHDQTEPYTPAMYPMVLLDHGRAKESRLGLPVASGVNSGGRKRRVWPMTAYVWNYEAGPVWDETTFLGYVELVEDTFRQHPRLATANLSINADTATSFVLSFCEGGQGGDGLQSYTQSIKDGTGGLTRYGEVICLVQEGIYG